MSFFFSRRQPAALLVWIAISEGGTIREVFSLAITLIRRPGWNF
jgi:hypothetical protein